MHHITCVSLIRGKQVFNDVIASKWREEALRNDVTDAMMKWVIAELKDKTELFREEGIVIAYNGGVIKSDSAISDDLKEELKKAVRPLEEMPEKDYHPGSNEQVLDLVHPSLFPLVYGRSKILRDDMIGIDDCLSRIGHGETIPVPELPTARGRGYQWGPHSLLKPFSDKFQWLPCDVEVNPEAGCKITSYINNLHPTKHKELYQVIEAIIDCAIPQWNLSLGPIDKGLRTVIHAQRICYTDVEYEEIATEVPSESETQGSNGASEDAEEESEASETDDEERSRGRRLILPEPREYESWEPPAVDLREEAKARGLQIIVKLANIELTPENPEYDGGSWHVEGQLVRVLLFLLSHGSVVTWLTTCRMNIFALQLYTIMIAKTSLRADYHFAK